jgi:hypothetical protein
LQLFLEKQGYKMQTSVLEQDNESAIKLEKNGRMSAGQKSRHINIRYFWIKDRTTANGITIRHCPTLEMLADFFTKPLQGNLFRRFRDVILGYSHIAALQRNATLAPEERVRERRATADDVTPASNSAANGNVEEDEQWIVVEAKKKRANRTQKANVASVLARYAA